MKNLSKLLILAFFILLGYGAQSQEIAAAKYTWSGEERDKGRSGVTKSFSITLDTSQQNTLSISSSRILGGGTVNVSSTGNFIINGIKGNKIEATYNTTQISANGRIVPNKSYPITIYSNEDGTLLFRDSFWQIDVVLTRQ